MTPRSPLIDKANACLDAAAREVRRTAGPWVDLDELRSLGGEAVSRAVLEWNGEGEFGGFAIQRARWGMLDGLRKLARQERGAQRDDRLVTVAIEGAAEAAQRADPGERSVVRKFLEEAASGFDLELSGCDSGEATGGESDVERDAERMRVRRAVEALPEPARQVIERRYYWGETFEEIAAAMGVKRSTVFDIHQRAVRTLWGRFAEADEQP